MVKHVSYPEYKDSGVEWLDVVPTHWIRVPIKYMATKRDTLFLDGDWIESKDLSTDGIRYITTGNVGEGTYKEQGAGYITEEKFAELNCTEVFEGDLLISRLNSPIGRSCIVPNLGERIVTSVDNVILRPNSEYYENFLRYAFSSEAYFAHTGILSRGATMQRISRGLLGNIRVPLPPLDEQQIIAAFLDHETAKIDLLIARQGRLIELLKEKRQAVISHAVTKGLSPDVPMKDSGVEWLGEVPAHWKFGQLRNVIRRMSNGTTETQIDQTDSSVPISRIETISRGKIDFSRTGFISPKPESEKFRLLPGDLLFSHINSLAMIGNCAIYKGTTPLFHGMNLLRIQVEHDACTEWLEYWLKSSVVRQDIESAAKPAINQASISTSDLKARALVIPPITEQIEIVKHLDAMLSRIDLLTSRANESKELLKERRTALVSAAVTGKIDVRGWQKPNTEPQAAATAASA